jgi:hypothetical protein
VTFGGGRSKRFALTSFAHHTAELLQRLQITELFDIGAPVPIRRKPFQARGIRIEQLGFCDAALVSSVLLQSRIGFVDYPIEVAGKSGVVAAYAAHGVSPVFANILQAERRDANAFPYIALRELLYSSRRHTMCLSASTQARCWYLRHSLQTHARLLVQLCTPSSVPATGDTWTAL